MNSYQQRFTWNINNLLIKSNLKIKIKSNYIKITNYQHNVSRETLKTHKKDKINKISYINYKLI